MENTDMAGVQAKPSGRKKSHLDWFDWLVNQLGWVAGLTTVVMTVAVMREVIGRYFFNNPSNWSLELSCYLVVALGYLAAGATQLSEGHVRVDLIYIRIPPPARRYLDILIYLFCLSWSAVLVKQGWELAYTSFVRGSHSSEAMMWPLFPSQVMVPIGSLVISLVFASLIARRVAAIVGKRGN